MLQARHGSVGGEQASYVQDHIDNVLGGQGSRIHPAWVRRLSEVDRPVARALIAQLTGDNVLGYTAPKTAAAATKRKGTLLDFVMQEKIKHSDKILLVRVGDFYECYGIDAIMLVQYAGLNPMGNKARAGCPIRNVQATLDSLTSVGLVVAVYEELIEAKPSAARVGLKSRGMSQIVSPGTSTYLYDLRLRHEDIEFRVNKPVVGISHSDALGYSLCEVHLDEMCVHVSDRVTEEALKLCLHHAGCLEPVYAVGFDGRAASPIRAQVESFVPGSGRLVHIPGSLSPNQHFHDMILKQIEIDLEISTEGFRVMRRPYQNRPSPVYMSTALQIGLLPNANVPDLVSVLLPNASSSNNAHFLRRWLLSPPPHAVADHFRNLCEILYSQDSQLILPARTAIPSVGKIVSLLKSNESNVALFRDVFGVVRSVVSMLPPNGPASGSFIESLRRITEYESGMAVNLMSLHADGEQILQRIDSTIYVISSMENTNYSEFCDEQGNVGLPSMPLVSRDPNMLIPESFFVRNEMNFRCDLRRGSEQPLIERAFNAVDIAAAELCKVAKEDFPVDCGVTFDVFNNILMLKKLPAEDGSGLYISVRDRFGKIIPRRWTTDRVTRARDQYIASTQQATAAVSATLKLLSAELVQQLVPIVQAAHWALVLQVAVAHTSSARQRGWCLPTITSQSATDALAANSTELIEFSVEGLTPYWIYRDVAVHNCFNMHGMFLLTAPNMAGKSTFMRAALVTALLANCGLFVPCSSARIPRFDSFFLRTASYDVPSEGKSAFALEMEDVRIMLRDSTRQSIVMVDELGKGTSARDGASLAGALLEELDSRRCMGVFATHLHELFELPLVLCNTKFKCMGIRADSSGRPSWTYTLEDGMCTDSLAMQTAVAYKIPDNIIRRAHQLGLHFDVHCRQVNNKSNNVKKPKKIKKPISPSNHSLGVAVPNEAGHLFQPTRFYDLEDVAAVLKDLDSKGMRKGSAIENCEIISITGMQEPPPSLEGCSCVYILKVPGANNGFKVGVNYSINILCTFL